MIASLNFNFPIKSLSTHGNLLSPFAGVIHKDIIFSGSYTSGLPLVGVLMFQKKSIQSDINYA